MTKNNKFILVAAAVAAMISLLGTPKAMAFDTDHFADSSKLAIGTWVKIKVSESGIHQITAEDAKSWGLSGDLSKVHVFGTGALPINEQLTADIPDDLPQLPLVRTEGKLLFYAQGPVTWSQATGGLDFVQTLHPYSTAGYYFVTDVEMYHDCVIDSASTSHPIGGDPATTFTERAYHEVDLVNPGQTGRTFLGEDFVNNSSQTFSFDLPGLVAGGEISAFTSFACNSRSGTNKLLFKANGTNVPSASTDEAGSTSDSHEHYIEIKTLKKLNVGSADKLEYTLSLQNSGSLNLARLNYITINYPRTLALSGSELRFGTTTNKSAQDYMVSGGTSSTHVWDVTVPHKPVALRTSASGTGLLFSPIAQGAREYVVFNADGNFARPQLEQSGVRLQNLHGMATPDLLIITHSAYAQQAKRIASLHEQIDSMRVAVVDQEQVFNEFSSGTPDAMAYRMLCKMLYDRGTDGEGHRLQYLLLMGDGTYDNRQVSAEVKALRAHHLLTWQSEASSHETYSYTSDDIFVTLDDNSGPVFYRSPLSIAVGRIPVNNEEQAAATVDKLRNFMLRKDYGSWKNNVVCVADDEDQAKHMEQNESVIAIARANGGSDIVFNHVYLDAFEAVVKGSGRTYPQARDKMFSRLKEGAVLWTYIGHASPNVWGADGQLTHNDIINNLYYSHLPVLYAATCEFARFDATQESGGEMMYHNPNGGVIALICPARLAYVTNNGVLSDAIAKHAFTSDEDGLPLRIGEIARRGKNETTGDSNSSRFMVLGDPAMRLSIPPHRAVIETINGQAVNENNRPEFKARQTITFGGSIYDRKGQKLNNFNGNVTATLFDCEQSVLTHGYGDGAEFAYQDRTNRLGINVSPVTAGEFSITMTIPSEIIANYDNYTTSLVNLYAADPTLNLEARGYCDDFYIYGIDDEVEADSVGPTIQYLGLNSQSFVDGEKVNESPLVLATIADESGVNFSQGGIGHGVTLTLDDKETYSNILTTYKPMEAVRGTLGSFTYQLNDLEPGHHVLRLKVWDVFNNSSEKSITFNVLKGLKPEVYDVVAAPNPASTQTSFYVTHNRPDATVSVNIGIYDLMGREVWSSTQTGKSTEFNSFPIVWNLTDKSGHRVPRGIYVYRVSLSTDGVHESSKSKKIAVTN